METPILGAYHRDCDYGLSGTGYVFPGQTAKQITQHLEKTDLSAHAPDAVLLHVGDIEARDFSSPVTTVTKNIRTLIDTVRSKSAHTTIIVSGLPHLPGQNHLNRRIADINFSISQLCQFTNNVYFVSNKTATLDRDWIHLTADAKDLLCRNIAYLVKRCI